MKSKVYTDYIKDIQDSIADIESFVKEMSLKSFVNDKKTINAVVRSLEIIGEAARNIPLEIRDRYPDIPWKKMVGMRDKLIHEYSGVNMEIVWQTIREDLPQLKQLINKIKL